MPSEQLDTEQVAYLEFTGLSVTDPERREVSGLALPYGEELERFDLFSGATRWRFEPGSAEVAENATLFYGHDHLSDGMPVGKITGHEHTDAGLRITARISETSKGNEVYTLLKDGVLDRFSVGLDRTTAKTTLHDADSDSPLLSWETAPVWETSVVPRPAYDSARIDSVLAKHQQHRKETVMPDQTTTEDPAAAGLDRSELATAADVSTLAASVDTLERRLATLGTGAGDDSAALLSSPASSYGEFLKMVAGRDERALDFLSRVETLAMTTGDLGGHISDGWVGDLFRTMTQQRRVINFFGASPLPPEGMNVEYGQVQAATDTLKVEQQLAEGDPLAYGKIGFETATAPVLTYGGWTDFSRQAIERSSTAVVERAFRALLRKYAQTTEAAVRTTTMTAAAVEVGTAAHDLTGTSGWVSYAVDAATYFDDQGTTLDGLFVAGDVFKSLADMRLGADGEFFLDRTTGELNVTGLTADLWNVPVVIVPSAAAGTVRGVSREAVGVWEAGGAPFRLQDDDITNLTKAMSIYGYMSHGVTDTGGITQPNDGVA